MRVRCNVCDNLIMMAKKCVCVCLPYDGGNMFIGFSDSEYVMLVACHPCSTDDGDSTQIFIGDDPKRRGKRETE